ncbi:MAG: hypothetical protein EBR82_65485 [Caulobacteraceae bacterium]|nr:hypothetical protein [Caulobacteraceae bacterium]
MELLPILLPLLVPIFSQLLQSCQGQNVASDPKAAILAHRGPQGDYDPAFVRQSRPHTKRAIRRSNRGKHRTDTTFVPMSSADEQTVAFFDHVLSQTPAAVKMAYASGLATKLDDDLG